MSKYEVDVAKLQIGESLGYKQLCSRMGWKYDDKGKSVKKSQLEALSQYVEFHEVGTKKGKKIVIDSFKSGLDYQKIKRVLNGGSLESLVMRAIIEQLWLEIQQNENTPNQYGYLDSWYVTRREFKKKIGLCHQRFDFVQKNLKHFCGKYKMNETEVYDVLKCNKKYIDDYLDKCLRTLEKKYSLIHKIDAYIIKCQQCVVEEGAIVNGTTTGTSVEVTIKADIRQVDFIKTVAIPTVLKKVGVSSTNNLVYDYDKYQAFYEELPRWISEHCEDVNEETGEPLYPLSVHELKGCTKVYECMRIAFGKEVIERNYEDGYKLTDGERELISILFQQSGLDEESIATVEGVRFDISQKLQQNGKNRHLKAKQLDKENKFSFRKEESYLQTVNTIATECHSSQGSYTYYGSNKTDNKLKKSETIIIRTSK